MAVFSGPLEISLRRAFSMASDRRHEFVTLEHLLRSLVDDDEAAQVMMACKVDVELLRNQLDSYIENEVGLVRPDSPSNEEPRPTAGLQRVLQRAMLHVDGVGLPEVSSANVLVAFFSEREAHATYFLQEQEMTRYDAVNFIAHGLPKRTRSAVSPNGEIASLRERNAELESRLSEAVARIADLERLVADSLGGKPIAKDPDVFVSYINEERELIRPLIERLRADGLHVWWDVDIPITAPWEKTIAKFIAVSKVVLVCWSRQSVESENVVEEAHFARARNKLIQVFLDDCDPPIFFGTRQGVQLRDWDGEPSNEGYRSLVQAMKAQI